MKTLLSFLALSFLFALNTPVRAARPTDEVKATADRIIGLLRDSQLQGEAKKSERRQLMRQTLDQRFGWAEMARSSLGRHWLKRSPEEQKQFVQLFSEFLVRTYLDQFETFYTDLNKIDYRGEKVIEDYASVKAVVITKQEVAHPVEYRMQRSSADNAWKVYDVIIEGVSLIKNYRTQFDEIVGKSSYEKLVEDLKQKLESDK